VHERKQEEEKVMTWGDMMLPDLTGSLAPQLEGQEAEKILELSSLRPPEAAKPGEASTDHINPDLIKDQPTAETLPPAPQEPPLTKVAGVTTSLGFNFYDLR
jgi:hypothetical protein